MFMAIFARVTLPGHPGWILWLGRGDPMVNFRCKDEDCPQNMLLFCFHDVKFVKHWNDIILKVKISHMIIYIYLSSQNAGGIPDLCGFEYLTQSSQTALGWPREADRLSEETNGMPTAGWQFPMKSSVMWCHPVMWMLVYKAHELYTLWIVMFVGL